MEKELEFFENYVREFDMSNEKIEHKYGHTHRVVAYMKEIAGSLNLSEKELL